jgi:hypothetical protein
MLQASTLIEPNDDGYWLTAPRKMHLTGLNDEPLHLDGKRSTHNGWVLLHNLSDSISAGADEEQADMQLLGTACCRFRAMHYHV